MFTKKQQVCERCGHIYQPSSSVAFVRASISPCPNCGSDKVAIVRNSSQAKIKSKAVTENVKGFKMGVVSKKGMGKIL